jgi:hypothetical protein
VASGGLKKRADGLGMQLDGVWRQVMQYHTIRSEEASSSGV